MTVLPRQLPQMERQPGVHCKGAEKLLKQLRIERADLFHSDFESVCQISPPRNINSGKDQRLIHRQRNVAVAADPAAVAERLRKGLSQRDADVLHRVVVVNVSVPLRGNSQVKAAVPCKEREHMIEKADAGLDLRRAASVQIKLYGDVGLGSLARDRGLSHIISPPECRSKCRKMHPSAPECRW